MGTWARFRWASGQLRPVLRPAIVFEVWFTLIFGASFVPASTWLLNRLVARSGQYAISDNDFLGFLFSLPGLLFVLLTVGFVLAFWFAEQAALLVIVLHAARGAQASVSRVLWDNIKHVPALLQLGLRQGVVYLLLAVPFGVGIGLTYALLLGEFDFYYYLNVQPASWWIAVAIAGTLSLIYLALAIWLYVRWILSIPTLLLEKVSPREALRRSWRQTRGRFWPLAAPLIVSWAAVVLASTLMTWLISSVAACLIADCSSLTRLIPLVLVTLALLAIVELVWFIVGKIMHVMLMMQSYRETIGLEQLPAVATEGQPLPVGLIRAGWVIASIVLLSTAFATGTALVDRLDIDRSIEVTGHRGSKRRAPENTLSAVRQAIAEGADFAEIDVQTNADGAVVLLHDADLMRVSSISQRLNETSSARLRDIDVGSWFDPQFSAERVPTLQEVIDLARGRIKLNIELKYTWADPQLVEKVGRMIRSNDFVDQCVVSSLNFQALTEIRQKFPELTTGFIVFQAVGDVTRMDADFLSISAGRATPRLVRAVHRRDAAVHVWTVNDVGNALRMIEMGVDNIITDEPAMIRSLVEEWNGLSRYERLALMLRNLIVGLEPPPPETL